MFNRRQSMLGVMAADTVGLAALTEALQDGPLPGAVDKALDLFDGLEGRLIVAGVGKSGLVGRKLAATFSSTGTPACFVHPAEASHGDLGMISGNDVVLLVSWSGETRELSDILQYARRFGVPVISITSVATSSLARSSDVALVLPRVPEACPHNLAPTTSTLLQMALGDALALTLLRERGFSEENFRDFHPGGKLGAALTPVSDIMITGDRMPLVRPDTPLIDALGEISKKSLGICGVCGPDGSLAGVITDGDIRRYLESRSEGTMKATLWEAKADRLMTPGSIVLEPAHLSARALHVLQSNKIAAAFAINAGRPVGVVTLNRLLTLGVA